MIASSQVSHSTRPEGEFDEATVHRGSDDFEISGENYICCI